MKTCFRLWLLGLGLMAVCPVLRSQGLTQPASDAAPAESVFKKTARLIREDAGQPTALAVIQPGLVLPPKGEQEELLQLDRIIIHAKQIPEIPPALHETPVTEFLRTGTIWERAGRKFTTKVGAKGDEGVFLRFSW